MNEWALKDNEIGDVTAAMRALSQQIETETAAMRALRQQWRRDNDERHNNQSANRSDGLRSVPTREGTSPAAGDRHTQDFTSSGCLERGEQGVGGVNERCGGENRTAIGRLRALHTGSRRSDRRMSSSQNGTDNRDAESGRDRVDGETENIVDGPGEPDSCGIDYRTPRRIARCARLTRDQHRRIPTGIALALIVLATMGVCIFLGYIGVAG